MDTITNALYYFCFRFRDPSLYLLHSPLVCVAVIECLIAIWAAESRMHWLWRWLAVVGAVTLMAPARAWEAAWFFALSLPLIVLLLRVPNWWRRRAQEARSPQLRATKPLRFSLRDLFLVTVAVAAPLPPGAELSRHFKPFAPGGWIASSFAMALLAVICYRCVAGPRSITAWAALPVAILLCAVFVRLGGDWAQVGGYMLDVLHGPFAMDVGTLSAMETQFVCVLLALLALVMAAQSALPAARQVAAGVAVTIAIGVVLAWGGFFYAQLLKPIPPIAEKFESTPNYYDRLVAIANRVTMINKGNVSIAELNEIGQSAAAQEMQTLFDELFPLLQAVNAVPYDPVNHAHRGSRIDILSEVQPLRALCRTLTAEARAAMKTGDSAMAASYSAAILRIGAALGHGGLVMHSIVGTALEGVGYSELARIRGQLSETEQHDVIAALQRVLAEREPTEAIQARDADFMERVYGFPERLNEALYAVGSANWSRYQFEEWVADREAMNLLLQTDLAIRIFQRDNDRLPASFADLVPQYLPEVPIDPYDAKPLKYRAGGDDFVLYSVGFDRHDDGGKFDQWPAYQNAKATRWRKRRTELDLNLDSIIEK